MKIRKNLGHFGMKRVNKSLIEFLIYFVCSNRDISFQSSNKHKIVLYPPITEIPTVTTLLIDYNGLRFIHS